jgi:hypothetical protein
MNLHPHTVTVYNRRRNDTGGPFASTIDRYGRTVIEGVAWEDETRHNIDSNGVSKLDKTVSIIIPLEADTGGKTYTRPVNYAGLAAEDLTHWTLADGDIIVFGECLKEIDDTYTLQDLRREFNAIGVQSAADFTNTDVLPHWEVGGK